MERPPALPEEFTPEVLQPNVPTPMSEQPTLHNAADERISRDLRRRTWAANKARRIRTGLVALEVIAGMAIHVALNAERNRMVRHERAKILRSRWHHLTGSLIAAA